jgi:arylformamidase
MPDKIIDLSLTLYNGAPAFSTDPRFNLAPHGTLAALGFNISRITTSSHQGTHLDVPRHFFDAGQSVDQIEANRFVTPAFKINLRRKKPGEAIEPGDLREYGQRITAGSGILLETGWDAVFPRDEYFSDFPYITVELAKYFADRKINLLGLDIPTPNFADWKIIHGILLGSKIILVESLANLQEISRDSFLFIGLPLKIKGADGSPIRAVALERD